MAVLLQVTGLELEADIDAMFCWRGSGNLTEEGTGATAADDKMVPDNLPAVTF